MTKNSVINTALQRGPDCPSFDALTQALELREGAADRVSAEQHVKGCAACRTELALFQEFELGRARPEEIAEADWIAARLAGSLANKKSTAVGTRPRWWQRLWSSPAGLGAVAAAAVVILAVVLAVPWRHSEPVREGSGDVLRSAPLRAIEPAGELSVVPKEFRWSAVDGAATYVVTVTEVDRTVLFRGNVSATSLPVSSEVKRVIQPGKTLLWKVSAEDVSGRKLTESGEQRFRLEGPPPK